VDSDTPASYSTGCGPSGCQFNDFASAITDLTIQIGSWSASLTGAPSDNRIELRSFGDGSGLGMFAPVTGSEINGAYAESVTMNPSWVWWPTWFGDLSQYSQVGLPWQQPRTTNNVPLYNQTFTVEFSSIDGAAGTVTLLPSPIPATVWLFGTGLIGLVGMARRKAA